MWFDAKRSCSVKYWQLLHVNMYIAGTSISSELSISWLARVRYTMVWVWYNKHCRISCWFRCVQIYIYYEQSNQNLCDKIDEVSISSCGTVVFCWAQYACRDIWLKMVQRKKSIGYIWVLSAFVRTLYAACNLEHWILFIAEHPIYVWTDPNVTHDIEAVSICSVFFCWFWSVFSQMDCCHASMSNTMPHTEYEVMIRMEK